MRKEAQYVFKKAYKKIRAFIVDSPLVTFYLGAGIAILAIGLVWGLYFLHTGAAFTLLKSHSFTWSRFYYERGNYYFGGGAYNIREAEADFNKSLSLPGAEEKPRHYQLGRIHFIKGKMHAALVEFNKEEAIHPDFERVHYARGLTYAYMGLLEYSIEDFKAFLVWKPKSWAGHNDLAWVYFRKGDFVNAEKYARAGLASNKDNPWLANSLGTALLNLKRYAEAKEYLLIAEKGFNSMTNEQWGAAYPGNDPRVYQEGFEATKKSVTDNLTVVNTKLSE